MSTMSTSFTASGTFSLTDANGVVVFSYSPSFTSLANTATMSLYAGEHLAGATATDILIGGEDAAAVNAANHDRLYTFIKNVDTDYAIEVSPAGQEDGSSKECADLKPGEFFFAPMELNSDTNTTTSLTVGAGTAAQKVQFLLCDAIDN
tara:strand:+ start:266 stop:712 length:447 start_codon:yes stop_codon:yes gene_type:complete